MTENRKRNLTKGAVFAGFPVFLKSLASIEFGVEMTHSTAKSGKWSDSQRTRQDVNGQHDRYRSDDRMTQ